MKNQRKAERFEDFGKVENDEICVVSGILEDLSKNGIKVSYSVPPSVDADKEYEIKVRLSRLADEPFTLIAKPVRIFDGEEGKKYVGFSILPSKDYARFENYISLLKNDSAAVENAPANKSSENSLFI